MLIYYAKLGFAVLLLSAFGCFAFYVIRRKLELERRAAESLANLLPKWLEMRATAMRGRIDGGMLVVDRDGRTITIDAHPSGQEAVLTVTVTPGSGTSGHATSTLSGVTFEGEVPEGLREALQRAARSGRIEYAAEAHERRLTYTAKPQPWKGLSKMMAELAQSMERA